MRSPGPYGGRPDTNSRFRSSRSSVSPTPNRRVSSSTRTPGWRTTYGTTTSSRRSRSEARVDRRVVVRSGMFGKGLQSVHHVIPNGSRGVHPGVRPERQDPGSERVRLAGGDVDLDPAVPAGRADPGPGNRGNGPPGHLGTEGHPGGLGGLPQPPGTRFEL